MLAAFGVPLGALVGVDFLLMDDNALSYVALIIRRYINNAGILHTWNDHRIVQIEILSYSSLKCLNCSLLVFAVKICIFNKNYEIDMKQKAYFSGKGIMTLR